MTRFSSVSIVDMEQLKVGWAMAKQNSAPAICRSKRTKEVPLLCFLTQKKVDLRKLANTCVSCMKDVLICCMIQHVIHWFALSKPIVLLIYTNTRFWWLCSTLLQYWPCTSNQDPHKHLRWRAWQVNTFYANTFLTFP